MTENKEQCDWAGDRWLRQELGWMDPELEAGTKHSSHGPPPGHLILAAFPLQ